MVLERFVLIFVRHWTKTYFSSEVSSSETKSCVYWSKDSVSLPDNDYYLFSIKRSFSFLGVE